MTTSRSPIPAPPRPAKEDSHHAKAASKAGLLYARIPLAPKNLIDIILMLVSEGKKMQKKLYRSRKDRVIGGVAGGLAQYFEVDSTLVRILFVVIALADGLGVVLYILGLILIPEEPEKGEKMAKKEEKSTEVQDKINETAAKVKESFKGDEKSRGRMLGGLILIILGSMFLLQMFWPQVDGRLFVGGLLVILGIYVLSGRK